VIYLTVRMPNDGCVYGTCHEELRAEWVKIDGEDLRDPNNTGPRMWQTDNDRKNKSPLDYHQNVDADYFEAWFQALCSTVQRKYGGQTTYLIDGARSHCRRKDLPPTKSANIATIKAWLLKMGIAVAEWAHMGIAVKDGGQKAPKGGWKAPLLAVVQPHREKALYEAVKIAVKYGGRVRYTPPYTPEVQPIERCWGNAKDPIGRDPADTMTNLKKRLRGHFDEQGMALFWGAWWRMQAWEDTYQSQIAAERAGFGMAPAVQEEVQEEAQEVQEEADDLTDMAEEFEAEEDEEEQPAV
jgi:hypothetical protein